MNSNELNEKIREICDKADELGYDAFEPSGKSIPYIGWFWREVDFDSDTLGFGLIPTDNSTDIEKFRVGFMENNKWGYAEISATKEETSSIKILLEAAVENPTPETLRAVNEAIQAIRLNWTITKEHRVIGKMKIEFDEYNAERKGERRQEQISNF